MTAFNAEDRAIRRLTCSPLSDFELNRNLIVAARKGWTKAGKAFLNLGADVNAEANGHSVLSNACRFGADHIETCRALLKAGADPNGLGVMEHCGIATFPVLRAAGGRINGEVSGRNPLMFAIVARSKEDKALALIKAGAETNVWDKEGSTPLMLAAERGRLKVVDALLEANADTLAIDATGRSVLRRVAETVVGGRLGTIDTQRRTAMRVLRKLRDQLPSQPEDMLLIDVVLGDAKSLKERISTGLDPNTVIQGGIGQLGLRRQDYIDHVVATGDIAEILHGGVLPSSQQLDGRIGGSSLLMWAVAAKQSTIVKVLLDAGANPELKNDAGVSPATLARELGDSGINSLVTEKRPPPTK